MTQVFVLSQENVKNKGYVTLFQYMTKNKKSLFARVVMSAPEVLQVSALSRLLHVLIATLKTCLSWHIPNLLQDE